MSVKSLSGLRLINRLKARLLHTKPCHINTAGILVIGDEILKGQVLDTNSNYLTRCLHELGVKVKKISIVGDDVDEISDEIRLFSQSYTYVITTGGIGPTHDDVTFEAVAKAFSEPIIMNDELKEMCFQFYSTTDPDFPALKLAKIPKSAKLNYDKDREVKYPNISVRNVYMFPGIPELLRKSFNYLGSSLFKSDKKFYSKCIYSNITEDKMTQALGIIVQTHPNVQIGSYPQLFNEEYKVKITLESTEEELTLKAYKELLKLLPKGCVVDSIE